MNQENNEQFIFRSSFLSKLMMLALGIGCFALLGSGEMLTFIASKVQADFFIPPLLFKALLFVFGAVFFLTLFSHITVNQHAVGSSSLLACIRPIAWENIQKIEIKQMRIKNQAFFEINFILKKGFFAERRIFGFIRQKITRWTFSWPQALKSKKMNFAQAVEQCARPWGVPIYYH